MLLCLIKDLKAKGFGFNGFSIDLSNWHLYCIKILKSIFFTAKLFLSTLENWPTFTKNDVFATDRQGDMKRKTEYECVQKVSRLSNKQAINNLTNYTIITNKLH